MDILFLSVSIGEGHMKAAEAVKEIIDRKFPGSRTLIVDTFKYVNPIVDKLIIGSYLNAVKNTPRIYGMLYDMAESNGNISGFSRTVNKLLSFRIKNLINEFNPSIIVCTHPFPLQMLSDLKRDNRINVPIVSILTDFAAHSFWLHDNVDAYIVAHESMKRELVARGIPDEVVYTYGIPVSGSFLAKNDKATILNDFGLDRKLTVLIMGGSLGFGEIRDTFLSLANCKKDLQVIVITGKNHELKKRLEEYSQHIEKKAKILSYTNRVADFMDISDFIITKPGGMTVAEALVKRLPIFIISPIPGHEEKNAHFLINSGAAVRISCVDEIDSILFQVLENPLRMGHMKEMAGYLARPNAGEDVVRLLERLSCEKPSYTSFQTAVLNTKKSSLLPPAFS